MFQGSLLKDGSAGDSQCDTARVHLCSSSLPLVEALDTRENGVSKIPDCPDVQCKAAETFTRFLML